MGSTESKSKKEESHSNSSISQNSPLTPNSKLRDLSEFDPRSPTENISRTPIQFAAQSKPLLADEINYNFIESDPRSPTNQFSRTPIVISNGPAPGCSSGIPLKLHNKLLDNAKRSISYTPTFSRINGNADSIKQITPTHLKMLESSPLSKSRENRKSTIGVGVLETNIDYTETDLDDYVRRKSFNSSLTISISENDSTSFGCVLREENCDPRSPSKDFLRTPLEILKKVGEINLNNPTTDNATNTYTEDVVIVEGNDERLLKLVNKVQRDNYKTEEQQVAVIAEEAIAMNQRENTDDGIENLLGIGEEKRPAPIIDLTADVREFDRKLTKIMCETEQHFSPKVSSIKNALDEKPRTPMKDRNSIVEPAKRTKLRVSDKPTKPDNFSVSKIPVFKEKVGRKSKSQCENIPPKNIHREVRKKEKGIKPKWDTDKTLVI